MRIKLIEPFLISAFIFIASCVSWTPEIYNDSIQYPDMSVEIIIEDCFIGSSMDKCADYYEETIICNMDLCT
jgi:hypothetical protein